MSAPVIVDAARTPIGTQGKSLGSVAVADLATPVLARLAETAGGPLERVILGNLRGPGGNVARYATLAAGLGTSVPGVTLDLQCGAGMAAIDYAAAVLAGRPGWIIAGGAQSASTQPVTHHVQPDGSWRRFEKADFAPPELGDPGMGVAADLLAAEHGIIRTRQDAYAARSHSRAVASAAAGGFSGELVPVAGVATDERPRPGFTAERLARFKPIFRPDGTVTAANSCGVNDGASAVLMCDGATHATSGLPGLRILGCRLVGADPTRPGWGVVPAVRAVLTDVRMGVADLDVIEINEAFAGQVLACLDALGIDEERNCPGGGALALGHAWASSGSVLATRLFTQLVRDGGGETGLAAIAIAGGQGMAMVVERC